MTNDNLRKKKKKKGTGGEKEKKAKRLEKGNESHQNKQ